MKRQTILFWLFTAATMGWMLLMRPVTPPDIVKFEFIRTVGAASGMLAAWGEAGIEKVRLSLYLDFVFLILYCQTISLGCRLVASFNAGVFANAGLLFSRLIWIAGACDLVENIALLLTLQKVNGTLLELAFWMAGIKFAWVGITILFVMVGAGAGVSRIFLTERP